MKASLAVLGLDVGSKRIGVARGTTLAKLATPLAVISVDGQELTQLKRLVEQENAQTLVVGLPRGLEGQETAQTASVRDFGRVLATLGLPLYWQDEAGTTKQAQGEAHGNVNNVDALAAAIILQDYLDNYED